MPIPVFAGQVDEHGKLQVTNLAKLLAYIATLAGKWVEIIVRVRKRGRSNEQNRYYWGVVVKLLADELGMSTDETHDALRWHFLRKRDAPIETVRSTTELSTVEFEEYQENIRIWAVGTFGVVIPLPNEVEPW